MRLDELFNTEPYNGEYGKDVSHIMGAKLPVKTVHFTQDDVEYEVRFVDEGNGTFWLNYGFADGKDDSERYQPSSRTKDEPKKAGNPYKVLSKVVAIAEGFLRSQKPRHLKFSGDVDNGLNEVYKKMGRLLADRVGKLGYEVVSKRVSRNSVYFYVTRDAEALTYGFSPVKEARLNELYDTKTDVAVDDLDVNNDNSVGTGKKVNFEVDGVGYEMNFWDEGNNQWTLDYGYSDIDVGKEERYIPSSVNGKNAKNANKVMANIVNGLENFLKKQKPTQVQFTADKTHNLPKIYDKMVTYLAGRLNNLGYELKSDKWGDYSVYEINKR